MRIATGGKRRGMDVGEDIIELMGSLNNHYKRIQELNLILACLSKENLREKIRSMINPFSIRFVTLQKKS
jgi:hypothetical protein